VILAGLLLPTNLLSGQEFTATMSGVVSDANGGVLPGAHITARQTASGLTRSAITNESGSFHIPALPVGTYDVTAELSGFRQLVQRGVSLAVGQEAVANMTLQVGDVKQEITVSGEQQTVNTTMSPTSGLVRNQQIADLPLNGRSFLDLVTLTSGAVNNRSNTGNNEIPSYSLSGTRPDQTRVTINGVDYVGQNTARVYTQPQGMSGLLLGLDGVQEFNVVGSTYGAEYGKRAGGQITIVTKSGTNQWHGAAFEYLRNSALNTRNYFDTGSVAPFQRNQFGGTLGGPIRHDKMFVFGNYEGFRQRLGSSLFSYVPDLQARQGLLPNSSGQYVTVPNLQQGMLKYTSFWPAPNGPELIQNGLPTGLAVFAANPKQLINENYLLGRFDYYISSKDFISQNLTGDRGFRSDPGNTLFRSNQHTNLYTSSTQETHIFSPTLVNVATFGYTNAFADAEIPPTTKFADSLLFVPGGNPGQISITGVAGTGGGNPTWGQRWQYNVSDDIKLTRGMHNISMGGVFGWYWAGAFSVVSRNVGTVSYNSLSSFLQDTPIQFVVLAKSIPVYYGARYGGFYIQDDMKLAPNLTVRVGLRDEISGQIREKNGNAANYVFQADGTTLQSLTMTGNSPMLANHGKSLLQPRVGLVWDPSGKGMWSVRAAFGIHNDLIQDSLIQRFKQNPPYSGLLTFNQPLLSVVPVSTNTTAPPQCTAVGTPAGCAQYSPNGIDPDLHFPTVQSWSLTVERQLTQSLKLEAGYVGYEAYHLPNTVDPNTIRPLTCDKATGCLAGGVLAANLRTTVPQGTYYVPVSSRPNPMLGGGQDWLYIGTANYHALNLSLLQRATHGLTSKTSYTFAKGLDQMSSVTQDTATNEPSAILNRFNREMGRGPISFVVRHQFTTNFSYRLPFGRGQAFGTGASGLVDKLIGDWQWNAILSVSRGFPITPLIGSNRSGDGNFNNPDVPTLNPNYTGNPVLGVDGFKKTGRYLDPKAFLLPTAGTYGNSGRNQFVGPGYFNVDTSLFKRIPLEKRLALQLRAEFFNVLNHANFSSPNLSMFSGTTANPTAGVITSTSGGSSSGNGRQIQFAARLEF